MVAEKEIIWNEKIRKIIKEQKLTDKEVITLLQSSRKKPAKISTFKIKKKGFKYMYMSDTHIGHSAFLKEVFEEAVRLHKEFKPDFILHAGDHLDGMSGRPGHIYELTHIGFHQQIEYAAKLYNLFKCPIYGIDGNHDGYYAGKNNGGVIVGKELERRVKNYTHLGEMEGDLCVNGIKIKLFHANDGSSYAQSYKLQKLIESFTGGQKPHILHSGHYHKALAMFSRNVYGFESGTLCKQSKFMRGRKLQANIGFGFVTVYPSEHQGVGRIVHEYIPFYLPEEKPQGVKL